MSIISIRINTAQEEFLIDKAKKQNLTISEYIATCIFPDHLNPATSDTSLNHAEILNRISSMPPGTKFTIPSLFTQDEWNSFTNTVSVGRTFRIAEKKSGNIVSDSVKFLEKKSGQSAVYKKK